MRITVDMGEKQPKLTSSAHLMNDGDEDDGPAGISAEDGDRPKPRKGKTAAGGKKGPIPPQFVKAMRARRSKGGTK